MYALTIWQPWASLIVAGAKPYEFRGWRPYPRVIGQRIVIHAAARKIDMREARHLHQLMQMSDRYPIEAAETCLVLEKSIRVLDDALCGRLPMSAGIGSAVVGEPRIGTAIAADFGVPRANDSDRDEHANWGWPMLDIEAWPEPMPMRGAQGLWNWPTPTDAAL